MTKEERHKKHQENVRLLIEDLKNDKEYQKKFGGKSKEEILEICRETREDIWEKEFADLYRH